MCLKFSVVKHLKKFFYLSLHAVNIFPIFHLPFNFSAFSSQKKEITKLFKIEKCVSLCSPLDSLQTCSPPLSDAALIQAARGLHAAVSTAPSSSSYLLSATFDKLRFLSLISRRTQLFRFSFHHRPLPPFSLFSSLHLMSIFVLNLRLGLTPEIQACIASCCLVV